MKRGWFLLVQAKDGSELRLSLHPLSLAKLLVELADDGLDALCRRRGHVDDGEGHCRNCGRSLPDTGTPYGSWLPETYRSWKAANR